MRRFIPTLALPALALLLTISPARGAEPEFDVVIRGGTVYDGTGGAGVTALPGRALKGPGATR
jgi:hypothetical protein